MSDNRNASVDVLLERLALQSKIITDKLDEINKDIQLVEAALQRYPFAESIYYMVNADDKAYFKFASKRLILEVGGEITCPFIESKLLYRLKYHQSLEDLIAELVSAGTHMLSSRT